MSALRAMPFCLSQAGGASGYLAITNDGGVTWTSVTPFASTVTIRFHSIKMISATEAYVAGSNGQIYHTLNAGTSWTLVAATGVTLYSIDVFSETQGTAGAIAGSQVYTIVSGTYPVSVCFNALHLFDDRLLYIAYSAHEPAVSPAHQSAERTALEATHSPALPTAHRPAFGAAHPTANLSPQRTAHQPAVSTAVDAAFRSAYWTAFGSAVLGTERAAQRAALAAALCSPDVAAQHAADQSAFLPACAAPDEQAVGATLQPAVRPACICSYLTAVRSAGCGAYLAAQQPAQQLTVGSALVSTDVALHRSALEQAVRPALHTAIVPAHGAFEPALGTALEPPL
jgi:hypothetical protein